MPLRGAEEPDTLTAGWRLTSRRPGNGAVWRVLGDTRPLPPGIRRDGQICVGHGDELGWYGLAGIVHAATGSTVSSASIGGRVLNIQRFAVHDGPGLRTTVFFKGCPARCPWCHNPESQSFVPELMRFPERCVSCGSCAAACAHGLCPDGFDRNLCAGCTRCAEACPSGARQIAGRWMTVDEVLADVESDRVFYEASNGGLTCSGGEPLSQPRFLHKLLETAKSRGLSTCVDTCGAGSRRALLAIAPLTDIFLYDLKTMDERRHRVFTGLPLAPLLGNLAALAAVHECIWIRIPIVPGLTDDRADLERAGEVVAGMPGVRRVCLLPYHKHGSAKFHRLGRPYTLPDAVPPRAQALDAIAALFRRRGLDTQIGGSA